MMHISETLFHFRLPKRVLWISILMQKLQHIMTVLWGIVINANFSWIILFQPSWIQLIDLNDLIIFMICFVVQIMELISSESLHWLWMLWTTEVKNLLKSTLTFCLRTNQIQYILWNVCVYNESCTNLSAKLRKFTFFDWHCIEFEPNCRSVDIGIDIFL